METEHIAGSLAKIFYVYTLAYPESMGGKVFYIGKGQGERFKDHAREARRGVQSPKCDVIRNIWQQGERVVVTKVQERINELDALKLERKLIQETGYENLTNVPPRIQRKFIEIDSGHILI